MQTDHLQPWHRQWAAVLGVFVALTLVAAACGGDDDSGQEAPAPTEVSEPTETPETELRLPLNWPWANTFTTALGHIRGLPLLI